MKSIDRNDFIVNGVVGKAIGFKGELQLLPEKKIGKNKWIFMEVNQKPVPFFVESVAGTELRPVVRFENMDSVEGAQRFSGLNLLIPLKNNQKSGKKPEKNILGFSLVDQVLGVIGTVETIEEMPGQLLLKTTFNGKEILIPAVEEFIIKIDAKKKTIQLNLPNGLLEL
ncbi:MAG: ribosome maturation factor RimM [Bacteroidia bacterium]